jgi:allophanate hydrolase
VTNHNVRAAPADPRHDALDLNVLRDAYRTGKTDPAATVARVLDRIAARGDDHVWIHRASQAELAARVDELDAMRDGPERLPLYGVPVAVKDNIDVAGMPSTAGCPAFTYRPARSAPCVDALVAAGAIVVGKTNLDQFATGLTGTRSPYGVPRHPIDPTWIPGGSSSGSGVAVAAGLVTLALATDTAGSGRVPAALCGIVGYKPAPGWCSNAGVVPACASFDCVSILARSVDAAEVAADVIRGGDRRAADVGAGPPFAIAVPDAVSLDFAGDDRFAAAWGQAVQMLAQIGTVVTVPLADFLAAGALLYDGAFLAERYAAVGAFLEEHPADTLPITREIVLGGRGFTREEVLADQQRLGELRARTAPRWDGIDALVVPTVPTTFTVAEVEADPHATNALLGRYCHFVNPVGLAAVAVPSGSMPTGQPFGLTLIGPPTHDERIASLARAIETPAFTGPTQ